MTVTVMADAASPFPTVLFRHDGASDPDGLLWCYGGMVPHCVEAIQHLRDAEGLSVDLAIVSQLSPVPASHIRQVVDQTEARLSVYVEEASAAHGWSAEILAQVQEQASAADRRIRHERILRILTSDFGLRISAKSREVRTLFAARGLTFEV